MDESIQTSISSFSSWGSGLTQTSDGIWVGYILLCWFEIMMVLMCLMALACHCGRIQYCARREHRHSSSNHHHYGYVSSPIEDEGNDDRPGDIVNSMSLP